MQFKLLSLIALATLVAATPNKPSPKPTPKPTTTYTSKPAPTATEPASQCSTGPVQCCNSVTKASDPSVAGILGLLGIVISDLNVLTGTGCSPLSLVGVGSGATCSSQAVCCQDNSHGGLISIGCVPVDISL